MEVAFVAALLSNTHPDLFSLNTADYFATIASDQSAALITLWHERDAGEGDCG